MTAVRKVTAVDSHTGGEPTRIVVAGGPDLGDGPLAERCRIFRERHDDFRSFVVNEPRGSDVVVGGLLVPPSDSTCSAGVIFFNNVGTLGMCGHGTIGLVVTLAHLGRIAAGEHRIETPVGIVTATLHDRNRAMVANVPSYRFAEGVSVEVDRYGRVTGDIAWGGNWFFLVSDHRETIAKENVERLTDVAWRIRQALVAANVTGANGGEIDHIELFGPPSDGRNHSRNFVLCPGKAYDRSPCGTGTSAKLACLAAAGKLKPGDTWRQESVIGSVFEGRYEWGSAGVVIPSITGTAYVTAELTLIGEPGDPFPDGLR
ncbi:4-hydroxyproline epimerase [Limnoglobus roseus]|uniref:Hydroxyproline-2-epimerase n=1 Tax=Limnoglobus roseus TaxID=2598579 RepID=A0A5C1AFI7_9BACT|nr:proline racemase family protein [Limnoglobus roseus]QEL17345.1 hydroxyproline-2-epimerase [Limnoglobus roseus]